VRSLRLVSRTLAQRYGSPRHHNKDNPVDELVFILLSSKTSERSYLRTYRSLRKTFPGWWGILDTRPGAVASVIKLGGLSRKKEGQLRALLSEIRSRSPTGGLTDLSHMKNEEAERVLTSLSGIGLKSARCVLMYSFNRAVFPVDTHCRRILSRMGFIEFRRLTDKVQDEIQSAIPEDIRHDLHVNLVAHGREICTPSSPKCGHCPISRYCLYYRKAAGLILRPSARRARTHLSTARPRVAAS
jgi:endonuclease III